MTYLFSCPVALGLMAKYRWSQSLLNVSSCSSISIISILCLERSFSERPSPKFSRGVGSAALVYWFAGTSTKRNHAIVSFANRPTPQKYCSHWYATDTINTKCLAYLTITGDISKKVDKTKQTKGVETSVTTNNSSSQDCTNPLQTLIHPGFKPFTV